jgi:hypothetical protein
MVAAMIHIQGMGLLGSLTAANLAHRNINFSWSDTDSPFVAWKAATGMVYPAGDERSQRGLAAWKRWVHEPWLPAGAAVEAAYVYHHKHPPHEGRYSAAYDLGDMRVAPDGNAVAVNAPLLVTAIRERFAAQRVNEPASNQFVIRAHGFTDRLGKVMWGWTVPVQLEIPEDVRSATDGKPIAFYSRRNRFQIVYAYPIPDSNLHWSGSTLVGQREPRTLDVEKHFSTWLNAWNYNFPRVPVVERHQAIQGWRPRPIKEPSDDELVRVDLNGLTYPPLWHSGIRWSPLVIDAMLQRLP